MFIGHYAPAFAAATSPKSPRLGVLFVAAQLVDIAFFSFLVLGVEKMRMLPGATVIETTPCPLPSRPWLICTQSVWLVAVQAHPDCVATVTDKVPPAAPTWPPRALSSKRHGAADWTISTR